MAGVEPTPSKRITARTAAEAPRVVVFMAAFSLINIPSPLVLRLLPTLFEMLFPVQSPGTSEIIDETRVAVYKLGRPTVRAVDDGALDAALHKSVPRGRVQA